MKNQLIVFAKQPIGEPGDECLYLEETDRPALTESRLLVKVGWLSFHPYMRGRVNDVKSYADHIQIWDLMAGDSVCIVIESSSRYFAPGDYVAVHTGWQSDIFQSHNYDGRGRYEFI